MHNELEIDQDFEVNLELENAGELENGGEAEFELEFEFHDNLEVGKDFEVNGDFEHVEQDIEHIEKGGFAGFGEFGGLGYAPDEQYELSSGQALPADFAMPSNPFGGIFGAGGFGGL